MVILGKYIGSNKEANLFLLDETTIPVITSLASGSVSDTGFSISALLSPGGLPTTWSVEYGLTEAYGTTAAGETSTGEVTVIKALTGLLQNTLYYFRIKAVNDKGTVYSLGASVTTTNLRWIIPVTGNASGPTGTGIILISATEDFTPLATGGVTISSITRAADSIYRKHSITINCTNAQSGTIIIPDRTKIISCGGFSGTHSIDFYNASPYAPVVSLNYSSLSNLLRIFQTTGTAKLTIPSNTALPASLSFLKLQYANWTFTGALPAGLATLDLVGVNINWTYNGALPAGLTSLYLDGANINWTYSGSLPAGLTTLILKQNKIFWTYTGALPANVVSLVLSGTNINWTYTGAVPSGVNGISFTGENIRWTYSGALPSNMLGLTLVGNNINWTYTGALPSQLNGIYLSGSNIRWSYSGGFPMYCSSIYLDGSNINWTGSEINDIPPLYTFSLLNYRNTKMSSAILESFLYQLMYRTGSMPATVTINDYVDYASPPSYITDLVAQLKAAKSITTVNLGA